MDNLSSLWQNIPLLRELAEKIHQGKKLHKHVHISQLIKHVLGLMKEYKKENFYLIYLWYNVPCDEGCHAKKEIDQIASTFETDGINFKAITYQELIIKLAETCRESYPEYVKYITERYL